MEKINVDEVKNIPILNVASDLGIIVEKNKCKCINPKHKDNDPSMSFKDNFFKCFGCEIGGSVIDLVMTALNYSTAEAIHYLNEKYLFNIPIDKRIIQKPTETKSLIETDLELQERSNLFESLRDFQKYKCTPDVESYFLSRGIEKETIKQFKIFSISDYKKTNEFLKSTYDLELLQRCGLFNKNGNLIFYVHKIMFPFYENDRLTYLRGRSLDNDPSVSKYLGLANVTPKRFYNFDILQRIKKDNDLYIVEGMIDCLTMDQSGLNSISFPGVSCIPELNKFKPLTDYNIILIPHNDEAGKKSVMEITNIFKKLHKDFIIKINQRKDINELKKVV